MSIDVIPRAEWGAQPWQGGTPFSVPMSERTEFFVHWYGGAFPTGVHGGAVPRRNEAIHIDKGWAGIGYNFVVENVAHAPIYEGRGWGFVGAHCPGHNRSGIGVQIAIGAGQHPLEDALASVRALYDEACDRAGRRLAMKGHRDGKATDCPGDELYAWVKAGMPVKHVNRPPVKPIPIDEPSPRPVLTLGSRGRHVGAWQRTLRTLGYAPGPADEDFGIRTLTATIALQAAARLEQDGVVGPRTYSAADRHVRPRFFLSRPVGHGARGRTVKAVQQALIASGYPLPEYGADGKAGDEFAEAVERLQRRWMLRRDGIVGEETVPRLGGVWTGP